DWSSDVCSSDLRARDVTVDASGNPICRSEVARAAGCVPTNLYTTEPPSQEWIDYVMPYERYEWTRNSMVSIGIGTHGELFDLTARPEERRVGKEGRN